MKTDNPMPKPRVPCKRCKKLFIRFSRHTKLCDSCWNEAQKKRLRTNKNRNIYKHKKTRIGGIKNDK